MLLQANMLMFSAGHAVSSAQHVTQSEAFTWELHVVLTPFTGFSSYNFLSILHTAYLWRWLGD